MADSLTASWDKIDYEVISGSSARGKLSPLMWKLCKRGHVVPTEDSKHTITKAGQGQYHLRIRKGDWRG